MAGSGQGRGWLLLVMLIVAVLLDARVMRLGGYARTLAGPGAACGGYWSGGVGGVVPGAGGQQDSRPETALRVATRACSLEGLTRLLSPLPL